MNQKIDLSTHQGWWFPKQYTKGAKAHWSDDQGRSLCGKWGTLFVPAAAFENDGGERVSQDECKACRTRLDKIRSK